MSSLVATVDTTGAKVDPAFPVGAIKVDFATGGKIVFSSGVDGNGVATLSGPADGDYIVTATYFDATGAAFGTPVVTPPFTVPPVDNRITIQVPNGISLAFNP